MQLELVNPFVEASHDVINEFLTLDVKRSDIDLIDKNSIVQGVAIRIGFKDKKDSAVIVNMEENVAKEVVSVLVGEKISDWDEMSRSALGEIGNMVSGRAVTRLEEEEIDLDIDPPEIFLTKEDGNVSVLDEAMNVILETSVGKLQVIVYLSEVYI